MPKDASATEVLDKEFLDIRCRLLDLAAALDRIDRATDSVATRSDPRSKAVREAARILTEEEGGRAHRVQLVFSDPYDAAWRG